jgi:hypothetical protein
LGKPFDLISSAPLTYNLNELNLVKTGVYAWMSPSFQQVREKASSVPSSIQWFLYDFEHWKETPRSEQKDVAGCSKAIRTFCDQRKWKAGITLVYRDGLPLAEKLAPYYDLYLVQCQKYQKESELQEALQYLQSIERIVHRTNPKCLIGCQLGSLDEYGDGNSGGGVAAAFRLYEATKGFVQVYSIWWPPRSKPMIQLLEKMEKSD